MNSILFLEPIFEDDTFKYIAYNFNRHRILNCIGINRSVYILCNVRESEKFIEFIHYYRDCVPRNSMLDPNISIQRVINEYTVITNATPRAFLSLYPEDDFHVKCTMFILTAPTHEIYSKMIKRVKEAHILSPFFYILEPENIEMYFMLNKIFEFKVTDSFDLNSKVATIKVQNNNSFVAGTTCPDFKQFYTPTGLYDCFINDDTVNKFIPNSGNNNEDMNKFARQLPRLKISFSTQNNNVLFDPSQQIVYIIISVECLQQNFQYVLINNSHTLNSDDAVVKLEYNLNSRLYGGSNTDPSVLYEVYNSEKEMLLKFIELYCAEEIFKQLNQKTGPIHWLINNESQNFNLILDRIFFLKMGYKILPYMNLSNGHLKLNRHAIIFNVNHRLPAYKTGTNINLYNFMNDVVAISAEQKLITLNVDTNQIQKCTSKANSKLIDFKYNNIDRYRHLSNDTIFVISTPIELINHSLFEDRHFLNSLPTDGILNLSSKLNISLSNLANTSTFQKNSLLIFYYFLQHGFFIMPCNSLTQSYSFLAPTGLQNDTTMTLAHEYNENVGGFNYSCDEQIFANKYIVNVDFCSYYPSILATYDISYNNTFIVRGSDLLIYMRNVPVFGEIIKYALDDGNLLYSTNTTHKQKQRRQFCYIYEMTDRFNIPENISGIDATSFYLIIMENPNNMPTIGNMCIDFINPPKTLDGCTTESVFTKKMINGFCGSLRNEHFKYSSPQIFSAMIFLGRRIINFVCSIADKLITKQISISDACKLFNSSFNATPCKNIINIDTDGFTIQCNSQQESIDLCIAINKIFNTLFGWEEKNTTSKATNTTNTNTSKNSNKNTFQNGKKKRQNYLKCRVKFSTDYLINIRKKKFLYIVNGGTSVAGYNRITQTETQHILYYYNKKIINFVNLKNNKDLLALLSP